MTSEFDKLLFEDAESIEYQNLPEDFLHRLVIEQDDQFVATNALAELSKRGSGGEISAKILKTGIGDNHLKAQAFSVLYRADMDSALRLLPELLPNANTTMLSSIAEMLNMDLEQLLTAEDGRSIVRALAHQILSKQLEEFSDSREIESFLVAVKSSGG